MVLPRTDEQAGKTIIKRIYNMVEEHNEANKGSILSVSMGLAISKDNTQPLEETYHDADNRMYIEKQRKNK